MSTDFWKLKNKEWQPGDAILINTLQWGKPELEELVKALMDNWFAGNSQANKRYEQKSKDYLGFKYYHATNSGSSALEIAIQVLIQSGKLRYGDRILHPILTFPTSIASSIMAGLVPVYVDVGVGTYVIDTTNIKEIIEKYDIKAAVIPALLGNAPHIDELKQALEDKPLIIDSCDVIGTKWRGQEIGTFGDMACYSTYGSHHISTAGVGGGIGTNDEKYFEMIQSMVFWGRDFSVDGEGQLTSFLKRYTYKTIGLDAQLSALQAAFGIAQWDRLPEFLGQREYLFRKLYNLFILYNKYFILPQRVNDVADISWFCFPLTIKKDAPFNREFFVKYLLENNIEIRPIMAGNLLDNPPYQKVNYRTTGTYKNAIDVSLRGFFLPACPMGQEQSNYYLEILENFLKRY